MKKIIMKCCTLVLLLIVGHSATKAQTGTVSAGGDASGSGGSLSYSIGQVAYSAYSSGGLIIEGLQQTYSAIELPITLLQFGATVTDKKQVALNWTTVFELDNKAFTVQRSQNGTEFKNIATLNSKGNSKTNQDYQTLDASPLTGTSYYRLLQTDVSGKQTYSKTVAVKIAINTNEDFQAYPNPTTSVLYLQSKSNNNKSLTYTITTLDGKFVKTSKINSNQTIINTTEFANGAYQLNISDNSHTIQSFKIIKK